MSNWLDIETDKDTVVEAHRSRGHSAGKFLFNFATALMVYCSESEDVDIREWFTLLESISQVSICELGKILEGSFCVGEYDYPEKVEVFTDIPLLIETAEAFADLLTEVNPKGTAWYVPEATVEDFRALTQALNRALESGDTKARIRMW